MTTGIRIVAALQIAKASAPIMMFTEFRAFLFCFFPQPRELLTRNPWCTRVGLLRIAVAQYALGPRLCLQFTDHFIIAESRRSKKSRETHLAIGFGLVSQLSVILQNTGWFIVPASTPYMVSSRNERIVRQYLLSWIEFFFFWREGVRGGKWKNGYSEASYFMKNLKTKYKSTGSLRWDCCIIFSYLCTVLYRSGKSNLFFIEGIFIKLYWMVYEIVL